MGAVGASCPKAGPVLAAEVPTVAEDAGEGLGNPTAAVDKPNAAAMLATSASGFWASFGGAAAGAVLADAGRLVAALVPVCVITGSGGT